MSATQLATALAADGPLTDSQLDSIYGEFRTRCLAAHGYDFRQQCGRSSGEGSRVNCAICVCGFSSYGSPYCHLLQWLGWASSPEEFKRLARELDAKLTVVEASSDYPKETTP